MGGAKGNQPCPLNEGNFLSLLILRSIQNVTKDDNHNVLVPAQAPLRCPVPARPRDRPSRGTRPDWRAPSSPRSACPQRTLRPPKRFLRWRWRPRSRECHSQGSRPRPIQIKLFQHLSFGENIIILTTCILIYQTRKYSCPKFYLGSEKLPVGLSLLLRTLGSPPPSSQSLSRWPPPHPERRGTWTAKTAAPFCTCSTPESSLHSLVAVAHVSFTPA